MSDNFFTRVSMKIYAGLGVVATIAAIVGMMALFENRYATAADVQQTQAQMVQSMKLININLEVLTLENNVLRLENQKRSVQMQLATQPNNTALEMLLDDINTDIEKFNHRIGELQNKKVTE